MQRGRQRRQVAGGGIGLRPSAGFFAPGMMAVTAGKSRHQRRAICAIVMPGGTSGLSASARLHAGLEGQAGERLADVERLPVAIVGPVVGRRELRVLVVFARKQAAGERQADDERDPLPPAPDRRASSIGFCRKILKMIWSDASPSCRRQVWASSMDSTLAPKRLILPSCCSSRSQSKTSPCSRTCRRDAVKLRQVQRLDAQPAQRGFGVGADGVARVVSHPARIARPAQLGRHEDGVGRSGQELADQALAAAPAVHVSRVEERDAALRPRRAGSPAPRPR